MINRIYFANLTFMFFMSSSIAVYSSQLQKEESEELESLQSLSINASCPLQNSDSQTPLQLLRANTQALEEKGNLLAAAQTMDRVLKLTTPPMLADLCYALDLNRKASFVKNRQQRPHHIATLISEHLKIEANAPDIIFSNTSWNQIWPYIDYLIAETALDPSYEQRCFKYKLDGHDIDKHMEWLLSHMRSYKYPISIWGESGGMTGPRSEKGVYEVYHQELHIKNYASKETEARESFAYRFFKGKLTPSNINYRTFYNLMVRSGFTPEDFEEGKYGYQDKVFVRPIKLQGNTLPTCFKEFKEALVQVMRKAEYPYVAFVFELSRHSSFTVDQLYMYDNNALVRYFFYEFGQPAATIIESQENRIYLCFHNDKRTTLDLHEMSFTEAFREVVAFIQERYNNFESECTIITGRGKHVNSNGTRGVLHDSFIKWAETPQLKQFVESHISQGAGGYRVKLIPPKKLVLRGSSEEQLVGSIVSSVLKANEVNQNRLLITHQGEGPLPYLEGFVSKVALKLFHQYSFTQTFEFKTVANNAVHLTWRKAQ